MSAGIRAKIRGLERTEAEQWEELAVEEKEFEEFKAALEHMRSYRMENNIRPPVPEVWKKKERAARKRIGRFRYLHGKTCAKIKHENTKLLDIAVMPAMSIAEVFEIAESVFGVSG